MNLPKDYQVNNEIVYVKAHTLREIEVSTENPAVCVDLLIPHRKTQKCCLS